MWVVKEGCRVLPAVKSGSNKSNNLREVHASQKQKHMCLDLHDNTLVYIL